MYTATFQAELTKQLEFEVVCLEYEEFDLAMWLISLIMMHLKLHIDCFDQLKIPNREDFNFFLDRIRIYQTLNKKGE